MSTKKTLTKADLVLRLKEKNILPNKEVLPFVDCFFSKIKDALISEDKLKISNFGSFSLKYKSSRPGRNFHTGEVVSVKARKVITFKVSDNLKNLIKSH